MGLEEVEFGLSLEKAVGISIPDGDTRTLRTPRELVRYLEARLGTGRWTTEELEHLVVGLLVDTVEHDRFTLDSEFRHIFP